MKSSVKQKKCSNVETHRTQEDQPLISQASEGRQNSHGQDPMSSVEKQITDITTKNFGNQVASRTRKERKISTYWISTKYLPLKKLQLCAYMNLRQSFGRKMRNLIARLPLNLSRVLPQIPWTNELKVNVIVIEKKTWYRNKAEVSRTYF